MLTLLQTLTSVQAVVVAATVSVVPLSSVAVVVSLNVVSVVVVTLLLLLHCFSIVHIVWKQLELEIPERDMESEDDALDPFVEDDFDP